MSPSYGNTGATGQLNVTESTLAADMAAYDRLPSDVRLAIGELPMKISAVHVLQIYRRAGRLFILPVLENTREAHLVEYRRIIEEACSK